MVAPLVVGLGRVWRMLAPRKERIEGVGVLGLTALACSYTMTQKAGSRLSFSPSAFVRDSLGNELVFPGFVGGVRFARRA